MDRLGEKIEMRRIRLVVRLAERTHTDTCGAPSKKRGIGVTLVGRNHQSCTITETNDPEKSCSC